MSGAADFAHLMANALQSGLCDAMASHTSRRVVIDLVRQAARVSEPATSVCVAMLLTVANNAKTTLALDDLWVSQWIDALVRREFSRAGDLLEAACTIGIGDNLVRTVHQHILQQHANPDLGISETAEALHVQRRTIAKALSQSGTSYRRLLRAARVQSGLSRMRNESRSVKEAAYEVGYRYPSEFARDCRALYGRPPREIVRISADAPVARRRKE